MQLPSNKVGLVLIIVVLFVSGTIIFSQIDFSKPEPQPSSVQLLVERATRSDANWLENFNQVQTVKPDIFSQPIENENFNPDSVTAKLSVDLFSEYLVLKQKGLLSQEDEQQLAQAISMKATQEASLKDKYSFKDLQIISSNTQTVEVYGDRVAQTTIEHFVQMDSYKNIKDMNPYLQKIIEQHQLYIDQLLQIATPDVVQEAHVRLINGVHNSKVLFETLVQADKDPLSSLVIVAQYQSIENTENKMYTVLAQYFKNNGILFETESTVNFWNLFE